MFKKLDHIAFAVTSTDEAIKAFSPVYPEVKVYKAFEKAQNVYITYLANQNERHYIELVEGGEGPNPVKNLVATNNRAVMYHVCYDVANFDAAASALKQAGYLMITTPFRTALNNNIQAAHFFHPQSGIIEIVCNMPEV